MLSRRWAELLQGPGPAWADVCINTDDDFLTGAEAPPDPAAIMQWFLRRAPSVRKLRVTGDIELPASLVAALLVSLAGSLRELQLESGALGGLQSADLAPLVALTALERVTLCLEVRTLS